MSRANCVDMIKQQTVHQNVIINNVVFYPCLPHLHYINFTLPDFVFVLLGIIFKTQPYITSSSCGKQRKTFKDKKNCQNLDHQKKGSSIMY